MTWTVYASCGDQIEVRGGATPPYERGDGIYCPECDAPVCVDEIWAVS